MGYDEDIFVGFEEGLGVGGGFEILTGDETVLVGIDFLEDGLQTLGSCVAHQYIFDKSITLHIHRHYCPPTTMPWPQGERRAVKELGSGRRGSDVDNNGLCVCSK